MVDFCKLQHFLVRVWLRKLFCSMSLHFKSWIFCSLSFELPVIRRLASEKRPVRFFVSHVHINKWRKPLTLYCKWAYFFRFKDINLTCNECFESVAKWCSVRISVYYSKVTHFFLRLDISSGLCCLQFKSSCSGARI